MFRNMLILWMAAMVLSGLSYSTAGAFDLGVVKNFKTDGYIDAYFYPPHNEYDPNPGIEFKDRVVARYGVEIYTEIMHKVFPRLYLFAHPLVLFGDSRPQIDYNYKADPIAIQIQLGAGFTISENVDLRVTNNRWENLGGYKGEYLYWTGISLRYSWGRFKRSVEFVEKAAPSGSR